MTFLQTWEEFARAAETLYTSNPMKCRFVMKYGHSKGSLTVKMTDDKICLQYRTEHAQDFKKIEKFTGQLMRLMASKDSLHH